MYVRYIRYYSTWYLVYHNMYCVCLLSLFSWRRVNERGVGWKAGGWARVWFGGASRSSWLWCPLVDGIGEVREYWCFMFYELMTITRLMLIFINSWIYVCTYVYSCFSKMKLKTGFQEKTSEKLDKYENAQDILVRKTANCKWLPFNDYSFAALDSDHAKRNYINIILLYL